jgi:dethiobiotin synthetase
MIRGVFVTGTDTGVGKTLVSASLLAALAQRDVRAIGMKPVASGCASGADSLRNADAEELQRWSAGEPDYALINPYRLREPIAPHLAAQAAGIEIILAPIEQAFARLSRNADCVIVEGVGGWAVPLSATLMQADLVRALDLPVILVVGLRLGCINHALLSARAIDVDGGRLIGWIANTIDPQMAAADSNLAFLRDRLQAPLLGSLAWLQIPSPTHQASSLDAAASLLMR